MFLIILSLTNFSFRWWFIPEPIIVVFSRWWFSTFIILSMNISCDLPWAGFIDFFFFTYTALDYTFVKAKKENIYLLLILLFLLSKHLGTAKGGGTQAKAWRWWGIFMYLHWLLIFWVSANYRSFCEGITGAFYYVIYP